MNDIVVLFYFYSRRNKSKRHVSCLFINITIDTVSWQRELREGVFYFTVDFLRYLAQQKNEGRASGRGIILHSFGWSTFSVTFSDVSISVTGLDEDAMRDREEHEDREDDKTDQSESEEEEDDKLYEDDGLFPVETPYIKNSTEELGQVSLVYDTI